MKYRFLSILLSLIVGTSVWANNLLLNAGFEDSSSNMFGTMFEEWEGTAANQSAETADKLEGAQSAHINASRSGSIYQELAVADVATGQHYELTIHYKVLSAAGNVSLNSYWESPTAGQLQHDEDSLWVSLPRDASWHMFTTHTSKPQGASRLHIAVAYTKGTDFLLDDFSLTEIEAAEPWFTITPEAGGSSSCEVGDTVLVKTYVVRQGNLTAPVTLELLGVNRDQWTLSKTQLTQPADTVSLFYRPTSAGNHRATLFVDCTDATTYSRTFSLSGSATLPHQVPQITLSPAALPAFVCIEGQSVMDTILVSASGCSDFVNISLVNNETPGAFSINNAQMPANVQDGLSVITFHPLSAGSYSATVSYATAGGATQTVTLIGNAVPIPEPPVLDYDTAFHFSSANALAFMAEHFNAAEHNEPLRLQGWQNVVRCGKRGWWTLDSANDEDFHCAKATAFVSGLTDTTTWDMWLVTPALNFPDCTSKIFSFRVRGDYLFNDMPTSLELYYIDAADTSDVYFELIETPIPKTQDEKGKWVDIVVDLSGQTSIADIFFMGFRYVGPGGVDGSPTFYVDDVIWGDIPNALDSSASASCPQKILRNGRIVILRNGVEYDLLGRH